MPNTSKPYKILFFRLNPGSLDKPALQGEDLANIYKAIDPDLFEVKDLEKLTLSEIVQEFVKSDPDIIHFSGHGTNIALSIEDYSNTKSEKAEKSTYLTIDDLDNLFKYILDGTKPRILFINACLTGELARQISEKMEGCSNCIIGMNDYLNQKLALEFTTIFYESLVQGNPVKRILRGFNSAIGARKKPKKLDEKTKKLDEYGFDPQPKAYGNTEFQLNHTIIENRSKLAAGKDGLGKLNANVPKLPSHFLPRPDKIKILKKLLVQPDQAATNRIVGICGMGGSGKSVLAAELARDKEIRRAFLDGIVWITLGQSPAIVQLQGDVFTALKGKQPEQEFVTEVRGKEQLREFFDEEACLLIVDDIWEVKYAEAFNVLGKRSCLLITTRNAQIVRDLGGTPLELALLSDQDALQLLANASNQPIENLPPVAKEVAKECQNLPLAFWKTKNISKLKLNNIVKTLVNRSLVQQDDQSNLTLHDLLLDYMRKRVSDLPGLHNQLLEVYQKECPDGWHTHPADGYFFEWLAYHLKEAGRTEELRTLLLDDHWRFAKLRNCTLLSVVSDYNYLPEEVGSLERLIYHTIPDIWLSSFKLSEVIKLMSQESLDQFVKEKFLPLGATQDQLKKTESYDGFVELMVRLGNEQGYSFTPEEVRALVLNEINKQKETQDDESNQLLDNQMATNWEGGRFVETGILNLRGDDVLPLY